MKKTFIFGLIAAALGFTACSSEDDLMVNNQNNNKGMVLRATVEQTVGTRATFTDAEGEEGVWQFAFTTGDKVSVNNIDMTPDFYTFTNEGTEFKCKEAKVAESEITWYAYFPSNEIDLTNQSGTKADVANKYALAGKTETSTTGEEGLNITMSPKVAILVINNQIGTININVKNGASTWVKGLTANEDGFNVSTSTTQQNLLSVTEKGTYYVAVPAGVQLAVKDGDKVIKSTGTSGLTAGKYYNMTIAAPTKGKAYATAPNCEVNWVQLWEGGPRFAEYNVGVEDGKAESFGGYYCWGSSIDKDTNNAYNIYSGVLTGDSDTATKLWGSKWRMPTKEEFDNLLAKCDVKWIDGSNEKYNNTTVTGLLCTGKDAYSSNSVFLPAAGYCLDGNVNGQGSIGGYWSSTPKDSSHYAYYLSFKSANQFVDYDSRIVGYPVRAVLAE